MPEPEPERAPEPERDYAPIPLVAAAETFELEAAHESTPTKVGGGSASAAGGDWVVGIAMPMPPPEAAPARMEAPFPMPEEPPQAAEELPPAPVVDEGKGAVDFSEEFGTPEREVPAMAPAEWAVPPLLPPEPAVPSMPAAPAAASAEPDLSSPTLAELYFNQGFTDRALAVYRQLLEREPGNERARARVTEIEALERHLRAEEARGPAPDRGAAANAGAARRQAIERTIARLEGLLAAVRREEP